MTSRITIDYTLAMHEGAGEGGLRDTELDALGPRMERAVQVLLRRVEASELGFLTLGKDSSLAAQVREVRSQLPPETSEVLVLGIGGSSLGARTLVEALSAPQLDRGSPARPRLSFPDNSDPWVLSHLLERFDPQTTVALVISKSGGTVETAAQALVVRAWLGATLAPDAVRARIVAITDPTQGSLRATASAEGWATLPIPSNVGGRFSALTAAGLLPACLAGADVEALLRGAATMADRCRVATLRDNPAALFAGLSYLHHTTYGRSIHVLMPYTDRLRALSAWFVQLWAESLGKRLDRAGRKVESGPTPLPAVGATDQHAQVQLFMEGPRDKLVSFVRVEQPERDLTIPASSGAERYLGGQTLGALLDAELLATGEALARDGRPSLTLSLTRLDAESLGGLLMLLQVATALAGELYDVDAFDQPGVEHGKRLAFGLLGREGYVEAGGELRAERGKRSTRQRWSL